jgi:acyl-coenzyme A thioesterase PaaI-like protein
VPGLVSTRFTHHPNCFGCGPENPASLGLRFAVDGTRVHTPVRFDRRHEGAPGIAHGGAVAAALDDTLGTLPIAIGRVAVTASLTVEFRAPALLDHDYELEGWVDRLDGRKIHLRGELREGEKLVAEGRGLFLEVDRAHFEQGGQPLPPNWMGR